MLTALHLDSGARPHAVWLDGARREELREQARRGALVCPRCRALLWLRAGDVLAAHFAHRELSDCPSANDPAAALAIRSLLFKFFEERVASGKTQPFADWVHPDEKDEVLAASRDAKAGRMAAALPEDESGGASDPGPAGWPSPVAAKPAPPPPEPPPLPAWLARPLTCIGCGRELPVAEFANMQPGSGRGVCRACLPRGIALD
jgi:hypothetical protein